MIDYKPETGDAERKVLTLALERRRLCIEAESENRAEAEEDLRFAYGKEQWPDEIRTAREIEHRPCLTLNKLGKFIRQVVNAAKQNGPSIKVFPVGSGASKKIAGIYDGMIRDIQERSDASVAFGTSIESAARVGEGYFGLVSRYTEEDGEGFDQELAFRRIRNAASVHLDPSAQDPSGSDAMFGFIDQWVPRDEVKEQYGEDVLSGLDEQGMGQHAPNWIKGDMILIAEYYSVEAGQPRTLALLKNGSMVYLEETATEVDPAEIVQQKPVKKTRVIWRKITGNSVLEKTLWPCRYIPIFRVLGEEFEIDGKVFYQGLVRPVKDSQRMYNYWMTNATEKGALEAKAPYIGAEGQFEGHETQWQSANQRPYAYLEYVPVTIDGTLAPAPQRNQATFSGQSDIQMASISSEDMKDIAGIYEASLGDKSNERTGRAIMARQQKSDTGTFHYMDNLALALRHAGRVLVDVIPKFYTGARIVRILNEDGTEEMVPINTPDKEAQVLINDITTGRYDARISTGASYATKRLEAVDSMMAFIQALPEAGAAISDIIAQSMDWPGGAADKVANRLRKTIPPQLLGSPGEEEEGLTPAQVEQLIQQAVMQLQQQFEASLETRDRVIKEYDAETRRLKVAVDAQMDQNQLRVMVGEMLAEFITQVQAASQMTPSATSGNGLESPQA